MKNKISLLSVLFLLLGFSELAQAHYSPELGRFLSRDPIEERGGVNLHAFVRNDGINRWDRLGQEFYFAIVPSWWELAEDGSLDTESLSFAMIGKAREKAEESNEKAKKLMAELRAMSDADFERYSTNGIFVKWISSIQRQAGNANGFPDPVEDSELIKVNVSRYTLIQWLGHERRSMAELYVTGNSPSILRRINQRANEELSVGYRWTSFAINAHCNAQGGVNFPGNEERVQSNTVINSMNQVHARQRSLIACFTNDQEHGEVPKIYITDLNIDKENCKIIFQPAQVVESIDYE